jgi:hypothetical protein
VCIKEHHEKCSNDLIVEVDQISQKVIIQKTDVEPKRIQETIGAFLNEQILQTHRRLEEAKLKHLMDLRLHQQPASGNPRNLPHNKLNFDIELDRRTKMLKISSKTKECVKDIGYSLNLFKQQIAADYFLFIQDLGRLNFCVKSQLAKNEWIISEAIEVVEVGNSLKFSRLSDNVQLNYFCAIHALPMTKTMTFKITILSVNTSDRYIDIGIMSASKFTEISGTRIYSFGSGGISYCGYSTSGVSGTSLTTSSNSEDGFKPGETLYMRFEPRQMLTYYNDNSTIDLKSADGAVANDDYHMFAVLYHPEASFQIEIV